MSEGIGTNAHTNAQLDPPGPDEDEGPDGEGSNAGNWQAKKKGASS